MNPLGHLRSNWERSKLQDMRVHCPMPPADLRATGRTLFSFTPERGHALTDLFVSLPAGLPRGTVAVTSLRLSNVEVLAAPVPAELFDGMHEPQGLGVHFSALEPGSSITVALEALQHVPAALVVFKLRYLRARSLWERVRWCWSMWRRGWAV